MPRTGYSSKDPIAKRSGYVSHDNNPVDRRGGPETHSGRINHARMNERASPDTFKHSLSPSFNPRSRHLYVPRDKLFSTTASDLSTVRPRDDLHRNEPSQELERRSRGYNPGYYGERVSSYGSSPQLDGLDRGYQDEKTHWPRDTAIYTDYDEYKQQDERSKEAAAEYRRDQEKWERFKGSTTYLPPHLRNEDDFDRRQISAATKVSKSYDSAIEKRTDHGLDYIGHMSRVKRDKHQKSIVKDGNRAAHFEWEAQKHTDAHNTRWRNKWQSELDQYYPREDD